MTKSINWNKFPKQRNANPSKEDSRKQLCSKGFCLSQGYSKLDKPGQRPIDVEIKLDALEVSKVESILDNIL